MKKKKKWGRIPLLFPFIGKKYHWQAAHTYDQALRNTPLNSLSINLLFSKKKEKEENKRKICIKKVECNKCHLDFKTVPAQQWQQQGVIAVFFSIPLFCSHSVESLLRGLMFAMFSEAIKMTMILNGLKCYANEINDNHIHWSQPLTVKFNWNKCTVNSNVSEKKKKMEHVSRKRES